MLNDSGYRIIYIGGHGYRAHHLAWLHEYGAWPDAFIDHINGARDDNRIANLRLATSSQNMGNSIKRKSAVHSSYKGVAFDIARSRWVAQIRHSGKQKHLGRFDTEDEAAVAYRQAAIKLFGEFARY